MLATTAPADELKEEVDELRDLVLELQDQVQT
jgi:polyhydroxyalkanoate synthesis regulator phasin